MKNQKLISALLAGVMCAGILTACSSDPQGAAPSNTPTAGQQPTEDLQIPEELISQPEESTFVGPSLGEFTTQDINGNEYTQEMFQDHELTLVNIFATWCTPCVAEMPDLEKLYQQVQERGVNVVGFIMDVLDEKGNIVPENLEKAHELAEKTGVTYPILLPDEGYLNGRLTGLNAFPETFFVDKEGNVVGGVYQGSNDLEGWLEVVEQELAALTGEAE